MTVEERGFQDQPAWADHLREAIWAMKAGGQVTPCPSAGYRAEVKGGRDNGVWGGVRDGVGRGKLTVGLRSECPEFYWLSHDLLGVQPNSAGPRTPLRAEKHGL